jgi:Rrf2 family protein
MELAFNSDESTVKTSEVSMRQGISMKYLEQLMRPLREGKIIDSVRGPKGGYMLLRSIEDITLGEIARIFEGPPKTVEQVDCAAETTERQDYEIRKAWQEATQALYEKLDEISINNLIDCSRKQERHKKAAPTKHL